jgi:hypothetical protein
MELYLQFGYGMMDHSRSLISSWGGGTVILSPRDLKDGQLDRLSKDINRLSNGAVMLDPQFYLPHSDHSRLVSHSYWPTDYATGAFFAGPQLSKLIYDLKLLNDALDTSEAILPGLLATQINNDWLSAQRMILDEAKNTSFGKPLCQTIAISADACRDDTQVANLLEHTAEYKAESYYLVCEHPKGNYLVDDAAWLANVLDIAAGLKLNGARVIIGYCNHQMLIASTVKADAIASGTWMNVRSFPPEKFRLSYEEEVKKKAVWYYCPQALSEYKLPFLDIAQKLGVLNLLSPKPVSPRVKALFSGGQPSTIGLSEPDAFQHYLSSLKQQVDDSVKGSFDDTVVAHETLLSEVESLLKGLTGYKIRGQLRDFSEIIDVNRAALEVIKATRGPLLRRNWTKL